MSAEAAMGNGAPVEDNDDPQPKAKMQAFETPIGIHPETAALIAKLRLEIERCNNATRDMHQRWLDEKAEHEKSEAGWRAVIAKWRNDYDTLSVRYTRAMEALGKYGRHLDGCPANGAKRQDWGYFPHIYYGECQCGLDKALASSGEGEK